MTKYSEGIENLSGEFTEMIYDDYVQRWRPNISIGEAKKLLVDYLDNYGKNYSEEDLKYIKCNFHNYYTLFGADTRLGQLYSLFECYPNDVNPYLGFANVLQKYFDLRTGILDVASGHYPAFGRIIAKRQIELGSGTITLYDPKIVCADKEPYPNMKIYKESFESVPFTSNFELITSIFPCLITKDLLDKFIGSEQNLFIALCNCYGHTDDYNFKVSSGLRLCDAAVMYAIDLCKRRGKGEMLIDKLESSYNIRQPILIYKATK